MLVCCGNLGRDVVSSLKENNTTFIDSETAGRGSRTAQHTIVAWPFEVKGKIWLVASHRSNKGQILLCFDKVLVLWGRAQHEEIP
jgi:hypothetical protein